MKNKKGIEIYKQNFCSIYKDQNLQKICNNYLNHIESMISNHGVEQTIIFHKEVLRFMQQSCMNQKTTFGQKLFWTKTSNGFPSFLIKGIKKPIEMLMEDYRFRQGVLTICNFYKTLKSPISYDVSTITQVNLQSQTTEYVELIEDISNHFETFIKERKIPSFQLNSAKIQYL
jgi:hypothetical protein